MASRANRVQAKVGDAQELKSVSVDETDLEIQPPVTVTPVDLPPAPEESQMSAVHANGEPTIPIVNPTTLELDEYPSPAFMKRARLSYGALFEGGDDKFEEDGGVMGKGRKR